MSFAETLSTPSVSKAVILVQQRGAGRSVRKTVKGLQQRWVCYRNQSKYHFIFLLQRCFSWRFRHWIKKN